MDADALVERDTQEPERIRVAELGLRRERLLRELRQGPDAEAGSQPVELEPLELRARHRLRLRLEDHSRGGYCSERVENLPRPVSTISAFLLEASGPAVVRTPRSRRRTAAGIAAARTGIQPKGRDETPLRSASAN